METNGAKTMNATQTAYATARALFETIDAACKSECATLYVGLDDAEMDDPRLVAAFNRDAEIHAAHGWRDALHALNAAEDAMVEWSFVACERKRLGSAAQHVEIRRVWNEIGRKNLQHRAKYVDLAFRLAAR